MPESEQQLGQGPSVSKALHAINTLIHANKNHGQIGGIAEQTLDEGLRVLADLPNEDFRRIVQEQDGEMPKSGRKRLA